MAKLKLGLLASVGIIIGTPHSAWAQTSGRQEQEGDPVASTASAEAEAQSDEIIVTAQKRAENLKDVPISITALSGEDLDQESGEGVIDALKAVPGVSATVDANGMGSTIIVRGVGGGGLFSGFRAPIAYYLDSVEFGLVRTAIAPDSTAFDLERVEALRGPQGTLYGASALNGVVRVLTKDVDLDEFEFKARAMGSVTKFGGGNYRGDAAINVPIVEDRLGARIAVGYQDFSGWISRPNDRDANDSRAANVRLKVKAQPTDNLTIGLSAWFSRSDNDAPNTGRPDRTHISLIDEPNSTDYDLYALNVGYDFGAVNLTSTTSYMNFHSGNVLDYAPWCPIAFGFPCPGGTQINDLKSDIFSQDILLSSNAKGPVRWSLGAAYRNVKDHNVYYLTTFVVDPVTLEDLPLGFDDTSKSIAVFGELGYTFLDGKAEITGGLRYFRDRVTTRDNSPSGTLSGKTTFESTTPRVVLTWRPRDNAMVYASYSQGFRSGILQLPEITAVGFPSAKPDKLTNYEIGSKVDLLDRRLSLEIAGYFIDWKNIQQSSSVVINGSLYPGFVNGPSASGLGLDVALVARPVPGLSIGANGSVNGLEFDSDVVIPGTPSSPGGVLFFEGDRPSTSPKLTLGGFADYEFPLGSGGYIGNLNLSISHVSPQSTRLLSFGTLFVDQSDKQTIAQASLRLRSPTNWSVTLFADNVFNEQGVTVANPNQTPDWSGRPRPRTVGVQLDYKY